MQLSRWFASLLILTALPLGAQELTEIDGHTAMIFGTVGRPPRAALGYRDGVFVTPATLERFGVESNSVVKLRHPGSTTEARIFPILGESRRDDSIYMARVMRESIGISSGRYRVEVLALGDEGLLLGPPETDLPPCGEEDVWVFQRVGRPSRETLELGPVAQVHPDTFERIGFEPGAPVAITVGGVTIETEIQPYPDASYETSIYLRGSMREELEIEDGIHQVVLRAAEIEIED